MGPERCPDVGRGLGRGLGPAVARPDDAAVRGAAVRDAAVRDAAGEGAVGSAEQPGLDEIEHWFAAVADDRVSRDEADRWAARWFLDDELHWDDLSLWALGLLHGIDLSAGPGGPYLHGEAQVRDWLAELRRRRGR